MKKLLTIAAIFLFALNVAAQKPVVSNDYLILEANAEAPLYTTYTSSMERAQLFGDKGYKMNYYSDDEPLQYGSDKGGRIFALWEINDVVVNKIADFHRKPVVKASFPDMAISEYQPWKGLYVTETFFVYSSELAVVDMVIENLGGRDLTVEIYPSLEGADSMRVLDFMSAQSGYKASHYETRERLISNLYSNDPYPEYLADYLFLAEEPFSYGAYSTDIKALYDTIKTDFYSDNRSDSLNLSSSGEAEIIMLHSRFTLEPGEIKRYRYFRGCIDQSKEPAELLNEINNLRSSSLQPYIDYNISLFSGIPKIKFNDPHLKVVYLSAFNLARGCMLPPSGETDFNFYVFSREPLWGWGHGHQVLHESLSMISYAYLDPVSAQNSQRVYMEQQGDDGLIAYRHGPRGPQTYPRKGMSTTSAPFYSWINWEIFKVSKDRDFLNDAYDSGTQYLNWLLLNRDTDNDGTFEWGPYGIIENVRDWYNVIFQVSEERYLDIDKEDISDELECLDLTLMIINEMHCLSEMAIELRNTAEAKKWMKAAEKVTTLVNERMWDDESGFFYHINKDDHSFSFMDRDLKRQEIIGFLALWAKAVTPDRAEVLVQTLTDTIKFWRKYGIPTLAADDPWYDPDVDYCCKWNGPVWLLWDYMVFEGLVNYGYDALALELGNKMIDVVSVQLDKNHNFWESYSADNTVLNCPSNYIWDSIMAKVLIRMEEIDE